jgi:hypothetical protein
MAVTVMLHALRYYWIAAKGYRLHPWDSPYLAWRMETFFGPEAAGAGAGRFLQLMWRERRRLEEFLVWARDYGKD